jgi:hypothetical protein
MVQLAEGSGVAAVAMGNSVISYMKEKLIFCAQGFVNF